MSLHLRDFQHASALKHGAKIYPEDIAGMIGLPYVGNIFYVDPGKTSGVSGGGRSVEDAFLTVAEAYDATTDLSNDVIVIAPSSSTGRTSETTAITWSKKRVHLIGSAAPTAQDVRAGLGFTGATGTATSSITISGTGCIFKNLTFTTTADVNVFVTISGDYNSFIGCDFKGALNDTSGDDATARAVVISGGQENLFAGCTFGADTFARSAANATVEFASAASRNVFEGCRFVMHADAQTPMHVLHSEANSVDRWTEFKDCLFYAFYTNHAAKVDQVFTLSSQTATCDILMTGQNLAVGFDDWEKTAASGFIFFDTQGYDTNPGTVVGIALNNVT